MFRFRARPASEIASHSAQQARKDSIKLGHYMSGKEMKRGEALWSCEEAGAICVAEKTSSGSFDLLRRCSNGLAKIEILWVKTDNLSRRNASLTVCNRPDILDLRGGAAW